MTLVGYAFLGNVAFQLIFNEKDLVVERAGWIVFASLFLLIFGHALKEGSRD